MSDGSQTSTAKIYEREAYGVRMVIAVDSILRGPALGGCRWLPYPSPAAASREAAELASAMTRKAALADLPLGGGKAVVAGDPHNRSRDQIRAFAQFVDELGGAYITAEDMGTDPDTMAAIAEHTDHVAGLPSESGGCGDPSPHTATGVYLAIEAALGHRSKSIVGARVAIQGVGAVGRALVDELLRAGARVIASDSDDSKLAAVPDEVDRVDSDAILSQTCDVLAPCGPPSVLTAESIDEIETEIICGAANNPLADPGVATELRKRGVLFVPDFLANAGGLIHLCVAREGGGARETRERLALIPRNLALVLEMAERQGVDPLAASERIVTERLRVS